MRFKGTEAITPSAVNINAEYRTGQLEKLFEKITKRLDSNIWVHKIVSFFFI